MMSVTGRLISCLMFQVWDLADGLTINDAISDTEH
jgi:hypothetical protein